MKRSLLLACAIAALVWPPRFFANQGPATGQYTLSPVTYGMQLKTPDGRVVFEYMTK